MRGEVGAAVIPFRFDSVRHEYTELATGAVLPHITGLLERAGWVNDLWYTEESCERGSVVHALTAAYDLGALDVAECDSPFRGWLLSHVAAMKIIRPEFVAIEEPRVHATLRYGGRPDRAGVFYGLRGVLEGKSGDPEKAHCIQTALQAILEAERFGLPAESLARFCLYWKENGRFKLEEHMRRRDFDEAYRIIRRYAA